MKKIIVIILALVLCFALFGGCSNSKGTTGTVATNSVDNGQIGETNNENYEPGAYKITPVTEVPDGYVGVYTVQDLLKINSNKTMNYILMSDLDLSNYSDWVGLSNNAHFDGNGHTISNLRSKKSGLFEECNMVTGLILKNVEINFDNSEDHKYDTGDYYIGTIANTVEDSITGCSATGYISIRKLHDDILEDFYLGGIVGYAKNSMISSCTNEVSVFYDTKETCDYYVDVTCGGIVGLMENEKNTGRIFNCVNNAEIYAYAYTEHDERWIDYEGFCGGIVGKITPNATIDTCVNLGDITGSVIASGIVATTKTGHYDKTFIVDNCINVGKIEISKKDGWVYPTYDLGHKAAGIIGELNNSKLSMYACYNLGKICGDFEDAGSLIAHSETPIWALRWNKGFSLRRSWHAKRD